MKPTRRRLAVLLISLALGTRLSAQADDLPALDAISIQNRPGFVEAVQKIASGSEKEGVEDLLAIEKQYGTDPDVYILLYNVACGYARRREVDPALEWLTAAVDKGYGIHPNQVERLRLDADLASLQGEPRHDKILATAQARLKKLAEEIETLRAPVLIAPRDLKEGEKLPVLIVCHPYGSSPARFVEYFRSFAEAQRIVVAAPCGSRLIAPDHWAWAMSSADFAEHFRMDHREMLDALTLCRNRYPIDERRIYVSGLGQGAALAFAYVVRNPQQVRGGVVFNGAYSPRSLQDWLPVCVEHGRRVVWVQGRFNQIYPSEEVVAGLLELQGSGLKIDLRELDADHGLPPDLNDELVRALKWIDGTDGTDGKERPPGGGGR